MDELPVYRRLMKNMWSNERDAYREIKELFQQENRVVDLVSIQYALFRKDKRYPHWLLWKVSGDIIKAFPKFELSEEAFKVFLKVFKQFGGKFVRHHDVCYFELLTHDGDNLQIHKNVQL